MSSEDEGPRFGFHTDTMSGSSAGFIEINGYYCTIHIGGFGVNWTAWVTFERVKVFIDGRVQVDAIRHQVPGQIRSHANALDVAYEYARSCTEAGEVGL